MGIRIQEVKILPEYLLKRNLQCAAQVYDQYVGCDILVVYSRSKKLPYEVYEFMAESSHFQHLAGIKYPKGANLFYTKCLNGDITIKDIVPTENMKTTSSKIEVLPQALNLYSAKMYKIGKKDLETLKNRFSMGIGNSQTVMGLDKRDQKLPVPVTVMNRKITDFCSEPCSIFLIMKKKIGVEKYNQLVYEITKDIFSKIDLSDDIKNRIDSTYIKVKSV
ncbi:MAG: hypothetical protein HDR12_03980 [Lachnospiraceae bacterium]|nr:hypothetical protein [Lachnospiraceae bacterium]